MGSLGGKNCLEVKVCSVGLSPAKVVLDSNSHLLAQHLLSL